MGQIMADTIKIKVPVKVYERQNLVADNSELSKQMQVVAITGRPVVDKKNSEKAVRDIMLQMFGTRKYNQIYNLRAKK